MSVQFKLTKRDRSDIRAFKKSESDSLCSFNRATILLFLDKGLSIAKTGQLLEIDRTTIWRIRRRYLDSGLQTAFMEGARTGQPLKYTVNHEAALTALACGPAPAGRRRWTIRLLVSELSKQKGFETITYSSVRKLLKKTS